MRELSDSSYTWTRCKGVCFLFRLPVVEGARTVLINSKHERMIKGLLPPSSSSSTMSPSSLIGKLAPAFTLKNHDGNDYDFNPEGDTPTAIFFYPKSGSYGCTREACQFRDALVESDAFKGSNLHVIGISPDSVEEQDAFVQKQKLTYPVLSDSDGEFRKLYGVGKGLLGLTEARVTYFIDPKGAVRDVLDATINYGGHVTFVNKCLAKYANEETVSHS